MVAATAAQCTVSLRSQLGFICLYNKEWGSVHARVCVSNWQCGLKWKLSGEKVACIRRKLSVCGFNAKDYGFCCKGVVCTIMLAWAADGACTLVCVCVRVLAVLFPLSSTLHWVWQALRPRGLGGFRNKQSAEISCAIQGCACVRAHARFCAAALAALLTLAMICSPVPIESPELDVLPLPSRSFSERWQVLHFASTCCLEKTNWLSGNLHRKTCSHFSWILLLLFLWPSAYWGLFMCTGEEKGGIWQQSVKLDLNPCNCGYMSRQLIGWRHRDRVQSGKQTAFFSLLSELFFLFFLD